jgi:hypothetical protein
MVTKTMKIAFVALMLGLLPNDSTAQRAKQAPVTYANFRLTPADLEAFNSTTYRACRAAAARAYNPTSDQIQCDLDRSDVLNRRLAATLEAKSPPSGTPANRRYYDDHYAWVPIRGRACKAKFLSLGEDTLPYTLVFAPCSAEETYRRIKWLERPR